MHKDGILNVYIDIFKCKQSNCISNDNHQVNITIYSGNKEEFLNKTSSIDKFIYFNECRIGEEDRIITSKSFVQKYLDTIGFIILIPLVIFVNVLLIAFFAIKKIKPKKINLSKMSFLNDNFEFNFSTISTISK